MHVLVQSTLDCKTHLGTEGVVKLIQKGVCWLPVNWGLTVTAVGLHTAKHWYTTDVSKI